MRREGICPLSAYTYYFLLYSYLVSHLKPQSGVRKPHSTRMLDCKLLKVLDVTVDCQDVWRIHRPRTQRRITKHGHE